MFMDSTELEAETTAAVEPANDWREAIEWLFGFRRTLAVFAVVLTAFLSFISVVGTVIGMIFVVVCALRTSRKFRVGLVASIVVSLMLLTGGLGYKPAFLPKPVFEYKEDPTSYCNRNLSAEEKAKLGRVIVDRRGIWWRNRGTIQSLRCSI